MSGYVVNIEKATSDNEFFRRVLYTAENSQLVVMSLRPGEEIGMEVHPELDQFIRIEEGAGKVILDGVDYNVADDWAVVIPAGTRHNVINSGSGPLKLYTIYSPPQHPPETVHPTRREAMAADAAEHGHRGAD
jgi:mannose-6-phosphate isomerase-like protein (cupin superfamily)